ncbi:hypothetical protein GW17_00038039 [Ensete ventricosum]|nr:hypothetical protein GW17_00038039 [Ensete ventricosum]
MASSSTSDRRTTLQRRTPLTLKTSCTDGFRQASIKATSKAVKGDFCSSLKHSKDTLSGLLLARIAQPHIFLNSAPFSSRKLTWVNLRTRVGPSRA